MPATMQSERLAAGRLLLAGEIPFRVARRLDINPIYVYKWRDILKRNNNNINALRYKVYRGGNGNNKNFNRELVISLCKQGLSVRDIMEVAQVSRGTAYRYRKNFPPKVG